MKVNKNSKNDKKRNKDLIDNRDNDNGSIPMGSKKIDKVNILIIVLGIVFIVWFGLLIIKYREYRDTKNKVSTIDKLQEEIYVLNNSYSEIEELVKKIDEFDEKNKTLNENIDEIKKEIEDLDYKISKYSK